MQLTSEGRTLIDHPIVTAEQEFLNFIELGTTGKAKLKVHNCEHKANFKIPRLPLINAIFRLCGGRHV
jgi:hypothetical protein